MILSNRGHAEVFDVTIIAFQQWKSIHFFVDEYPKLKEMFSIDALLEEFLQLQVAVLPQAILDENDVSRQWSLVQAIYDHHGQPKYCLLSKLAKYVLLIPHSNASCERTFSHVKRYALNADQTC